MLKQSPKNKKVVNISKGTIGIDEVGRGPLAGPITVCAFYLEDEKAALKDLFQNIIRDSKKLNKHNRYNIYKTIRKKRYNKIKMEYAIASRSARYIDTYGISRATSSCIGSCLRKLEKKGIAISNVKIRLDAGLVVPLEDLQQESFIKGDERFVEIALASIMAKVTRDRYMNSLSKVHTEYGWDQNVGYGTKQHREAIKNRGITDFHRKSFLKEFSKF